MNRLWKGAISGGVIVYAWGAISWMVLPWHSRTLHTFDHDADVMRMIDFGTPTSGMYVSPAMSAKEMKSGIPLTLVSISKKGMRPMGEAMAIGLLLQTLGALILSCFLSRTPGLAYGQRILFAGAFGLAVGVLGFGPNWVWWGFPLDYTVVSILDCVIAWTLAGLALGKVL